MLYNASLGCLVLWGMLNAKHSILWDVKDAKYAKLNASYANDVKS